MTSWHPGYYNVCNLGFSRVFAPVREGGAKDGAHKPGAALSGMQNAPGRGRMGAKDGARIPGATLSGMQNAPGRGRMGAKVGARTPGATLSSANRHLGAAFIVPGDPCAGTRFPEASANTDGGKLP